MEPHKLTWPKITLVTPTLNVGPFLEQTFLSIFPQKYPSLEYIVIDGGSSDGTVGTIKKYEKYITFWVSEQDKGIHEAINKGFNRSTGDILGWLSGTDMLHTGALYVVGGIFQALPTVKWITGIPTSFDETGATTGIGGMQRWSRYRFLAGANQYIQQESTFWRRSLWHEAGGYVDESIDFGLWLRFFRYTQLYSVQTVIGGYRFHGKNFGSSSSFISAKKQALKLELQLTPCGMFIKLFCKIDRVMRKIPKVRGIWWNLVMKSLYRCPGRDLPPVIKYDDRVPTKWIIS